MPYLRLTCPEVSPERRRIIALRLTEELGDLFFSPRGGPTREELRERTSIHFQPYGEADVFIGGQTPQERRKPDLTAELSDWNMGVKTQRRVAAQLTPVLAELFGVGPQELDNVNIRFHSYPPRDFAVGGRLIADLVPRIGQLMKRLSS